MKQQHIYCVAVLLCCYFAILLLMAIFLMKHHFQKDLIFLNKDASLKDSKRIQQIWMTNNSSLTPMIKLPEDWETRKKEKRKKKKIHSWPKHNEIKWLWWQHPSIGTTAHHQPTLQMLQMLQMWLESAHHH